jgi:GNAT superfamily N-acetyltransferase
MSNAVTGIELRVAKLAEILALRHRELRPGLPPESAVFDGDDEPTTLHVGAFLAESGENVGCASFMLRPFAAETPGIQLRGMATRSDLVGRGIGRALLARAEQVLAERSLPRLLWCNARRAAVPFYEKLGWRVVSPEFDVPTVGPHYTMIRS